MHKKTRSSVPSGASENGNRGLSQLDKYVLLQAKCERLERALQRLGEAMSYWREVALQAQADRDYYREQGRER